MKILCIGRNYAGHAREMKSEVPAEPVVFAKPDTALLLPHNPFYIPDFSSDVHHELELVVRIDRLGKHIEERFAHKYYSEVTVGIDFTARDVQSGLKEKGLPWEKAKGFDGSAVVGEMQRLKDVGHVQNLDIALEVNGSERQKINTREMLFPVNRLVAHLSGYFTLRQGDLIFTGTPAGVGAVKRDDLLEGYIQGVRVFSVHVK